MTDDAVFLKQTSEEKSEVIFFSKDTFRVLREVSWERERQERKWGQQNHDLTMWLTILQEELGEVAQAFLDGKPTDHVRSELVQSAAVIVACIENIDDDKRENMVTWIDNLPPAQEEEEKEERE